jgi:hypothetical protein
MIVKLLLYNQTKPNPPRGGDGKLRVSSGEEKMAGLPGMRQFGFFYQTITPVKNAWRQAAARDGALLGT